MKPLGVQLYSVREQLALDRADTLRRLAGLGYSVVEAFDPARDPAGLRALLDEAGLTVCATHAAVLSDHRDAIADAAATLGTGTVIVPAVPAEEFADRDGVRRTADRLAEAADWAAGRGLALGYHNHWWELASVIDGEPALDLLARSLPPEVFLEVDVYWATVGGVDVPALLGRLGDRVRYLHVKDGPADAPESAMTAVGGGRVPIPDILAAAPADAWRVVELDRCATDMLTALGDSYRYVHEVEKQS